jgi:hypothetical protein
MMRAEHGWEGALPFRDGGSASRMPFALAGRVHDARRLGLCGGTPAQSLREGVVSQGVRGPRPPFKEPRPSRGCAGRSLSPQGGPPGVERMTDPMGTAFQSPIQSPAGVARAARLPALHPKGVVWGPRERHTGCGAVSREAAWQGSVNERLTSHPAREEDANNFSDLTWSAGAAGWGSTPPSAGRAGA